MAVEPLTSQNRTVTTRLSPSMLRPERAASSLAASSLGMYLVMGSCDWGAVAAPAGAGGGVGVAGGAGGGGAAPEAPTGRPQLWQNFAPGITSAPQLAHVTAIGVPQFAQNLALSGFSAWQLRHFTSCSFRLKAGAPPCLKDGP